LKITKDKLIKHYHKGKYVTSLCHVTDSLYLVGFFSNGLILWNEHRSQQLSEIYYYYGVFSIKRVMTTNNYVFKTQNEGVKVVTINDFESFKFTTKDFLDAKDG
jgi:hypothetical protein